MNRFTRLLEHAFCCVVLCAFAYSTSITHAAFNFTPSGLQGESLNNPTSLQFGPDGRLYVAQQDGTIFAYTISRQGSNNYVVIDIETILLIKLMPNHNDDGTPNPNLGKRQVTGILVSGSPQQPVLYVSSSDPRIGGPSGDKNLDTNSGVVSRLTWNGNAWDKVDLVRGLPRSEENHSVNGMQLDEVSNTLYLVVGGNTNAGSPSQNLASLTEYAYSCAILTIDLDALDALPSQFDQYMGSFYKYDLPTLDDPERANTEGNNDINDPWGGNDGLNQAKLVEGGPVQIYATGFRNAYDLLITRLPGKEGRMYTVDNGPNGGWGGYPDGEGPPVNGVSSATNKYLTGEPGSSTPIPGGEQEVNNLDNLHFVTGPGFYGGHPTPIRANPTGAGLYTNDTNDASLGTWRTQPSELPVDWPPVPPSMANPIEGDYLQPGVDDNALATFLYSTNGIAEYTASNFSGELQGNLILASFGGNLERIELSEDGTQATNVSTFASNFGSFPLDVVAQGDGETFAGTIWAVTYGSDSISIFEPSDYDGGEGFTCSGINDPEKDEDGDGYSNAEEIMNGSDPCSAANVPSDFDNDLISDLLDTDDDNDGIVDSQDPYPRDKYNGKKTSVPLDYPLLNGDPGIGFFGLGFTGLMSNGSDDYIDLFDENIFIAGGAAGVLTIDGVTQTSALGSQNDQQNALQFGIDVNSTSGPFLVHVRMSGDVLGNPIPTDGRSVGAYIGTGDQDNYLKFVVVATANGPELTIVHENDAIAETTTPSPNITSFTQLVNLDLFFLIDPGLGTVQPQYSIDGGPLVTLGSPISLSGNLLNTLQGRDALAIGVIASATNDDGDFVAQWDFIDVQPVSTDAPGIWDDLAPSEPASPGFSCHENAYVKAGSKYYLIGGRGGARPVQIYDPITDTWSSGATAPTEMHHFQAVELDGLIYVVGAWKGNFPGEQNLDNIYIYNPLSDSWTTGPPIPGDRNRGSAGAIAYNGKIYVVAGNDGGHNTGATLIAWLDEFCPVTNTWTQLADAPRGRDHFQVAIVNDKMYVAGGRDSSNSDLFGSTIGEVDVYDFSSNSWSTLANDIPTQRAGTTSVTYNGEVIVIGGESSQAAAHDEVEALNPQSNTWRSLAPLNLGRHATQAIVDNGAIYIAAGSKTKGATEIGSEETFFQEIYQVNGVLPATGDPLVAGTLSATPSSLNFNTVPGLLPQSTNVTLNNAGGDQAITVNGISKSGYAGIGLNLGPSFPVVIPPNRAISFEVVFDSNLPGEKTGDIYIQHEGANEDIIIPINGGGGDQPPILYRVNAGGGGLIGSRGLNWDADTTGNPSPYVNGTETNDTSSTVITVTPDASVPTDTPVALFQSERWDSLSSPEMQWNFPVDNGNYEVRLYFAEIYSVTGSPGQRVFDVAIEGATVLDNYDVVADAGAMYVGIMKNFQVAVADGQLTIDFTHIVQNPAINGIEIIDLNNGGGGPDNNIPTITPVADQTNSEQDTLSLQVIASDPDGDTLTYSASGLPPGLSIGASTGLISGTIATGAGAGSPYSVTVTVTDNGTPQASSNISFAWNVGGINNPPNIVPISDKFNTVGDMVNLNVDAADLDLGDTLSYSAANLPDGLIMEPTTGQIIGTIATGAETGSPYSVTVTVTDDGIPQESADTSFSWTINSEGPSNNAPTLTPVAEQSNTVAEVVSLQVIASDADAGDTLSYSAAGLPAGLSVDPVSGLISGTIASDADLSSPYSVTVSVTDDGTPPESADTSFAWIVNALPPETPALFRVNCGGSQLTSIDDEPLDWSADTSGSPSIYVNSSQTNTTYTTPASVSPGPSVPAGVPLALFQSERYDLSTSPEMQWNFPLENGNYEVRLYFAETYSGTGSPGQRVFDVAIEGVLALDDYDVVADAGAMFIGVMQNFEVEVTDELLTIDLLHVVQNPAIKGIEIIDLNASNTAPTLTPVAEQTNIVAEVVSLQILASDADAGDILSYSATGLPAGLSIDPASGLISGTIASDADLSSPYSVTVSVTDDGTPPESADTSFAWTINSEGPSNNAPTLTPVAEQSNIVAEVVSLQVLASDADAGDTLGYSATGLPPGLAIDPASGLISGTIASDADLGSPYSVTVTVTDDGFPPESADTSFAWIVNPINNAPTVNPVTEQSNTVAEVVSLQVIASDADAGDTLSYSATGLPAGLSIDPASGLISGTIASDADLSSPYSVTVSVTDDGTPPESADTSFAWIVNALPPETPALFRVNCGGSQLTSIDDKPLDWSSDTSGSPSIYVNSSQTNTTYTTPASVSPGPSVPAGVPLALFQSERYDLSTSPEMQWNFPLENGNYEVRLYFAETYSGTGSPGQRVFDVAIEGVLALDDYDVVADAGAMFIGVMQNFEVEVTDELLTIDLLHVVQNPAIKGIEIIDLNASNTAPTLTPVAEQSNIVAEVVSLQILASDADAGDTLSYDATGLPAGLSIDPVSGLISGTIASDADLSSPYSVTVSVTDDGFPPENADTSFAWIVNPINNAPTITPIAGQTHTVADLVSFQVLASDADAGDILSYSATGLPTGLSINPVSGLISGTIAAGAEAGSPYAVMVSVTDDGIPPESADTSFAWTINSEGPSNNAPTLTPVAAQSNIVAEVVSLQILASDADAGDTLSYSAAGLPAGLSVDPVSGLISGTVASDADLGSPYSVTVTVTDDGFPQESADTSFAWIVNALPPETPALFRVNCGGSQLTSIDDEPLDWSSDTGGSPSPYVNSADTNKTYSTGSSITAGPSVPAGVPLALFQSERYDLSTSPEMQWNFPLENGNYEVRLYFAETYSGTGSPGQRVFDVAIEGVLALDDYDVVADAGAMFIGVMQNFEVEVTDELLTIDLLHVVQNPAIKGIEIIDLNGTAPSPSSTELVNTFSSEDPSGPTQFSRHLMEILVTDNYDLAIQYQSSLAETVSWELLDSGQSGSFITSGSGVSDFAYISGLTISEGLQILELSYSDAVSIEYIDALLSDPDSNTGTISSTGTDLSAYLADTDPVTGDFQIVTSIQNLNNSGAKPEVGILIQEPSSGTMRFVQLGIQLDQRYYLRSLTDLAQSIQEVDTGVVGQLPGASMLLQRVGDEISVAVSDNDEDYDLLQVITIPGLADTLEAGLYIDSGSEGVEASATIQNFEVIALP